jgi:glycosyltransferase involved in cell wall biosynthesis
MNIILAYNDSRFWTVGSYIQKILSQQNEINIVGHARIPEDSGMCEEQCNLSADLILVIDDGITHFKLHHHKGKLGKAKTAFWISDLHRSDWASWRLQMIREFKYDHVFYAQKNFRKMVEECGYEYGKTCSWLPHAADPDIFRPMPQIEKQYDIGFVGFSNEKRDRISKIIAEYCNYKQFSTVWAWQAARCINECKIGLNVPVMDDIANMRSFEVGACGLPLLIEKHDNGLEDLFESDMYLAYTNDQELRELAVRLIASSDLRKRMGEKLRMHVLAHHTYRNRVNTLLGKMGFELLRSF